MVEQINHANKTCPYDKAGLISRYFVFWLLPMLCYSYKLSRQPKPTSLSIDELYARTKDDKSDELGQRLLFVWKLELKKRGLTEASLKRVLMQVFGWQYFRCALWEMFSKCIIGPSIAITLGWLMRDVQKFMINDSIQKFSTPAPSQILQDSYSSVTNVNFQLTDNQTMLYSNSTLLGHQTKDIDRHAIILKSILLSTLMALYLFTSHPYLFNSTHLGMRCRLACSYIIYRKSLTLSQSSINMTTTGQIINLLSNDVNKFDSSFYYLAYLYIAPLQALISVIILGSMYVGPLPALVGTFAIVTYLSFQLIMNRLFGAVRDASLQKTDERVRLMTELIDSMRIVKMYAWEKSFENHINEARENELDCMANVITLRTINLSLFYGLIKLILLCIFVTYVLQGNAFDPAKVFTAIALANSLRTYLTLFFPYAIAQYSELIVSLDRIRNYLILEEKSEMLAEDEMKSDKILPQSSTLKVVPTIGATETVSNRLTNQLTTTDNDRVMNKRKDIDKSTNVGTITFQSVSARWPSQYTNMHTDNNILNNISIKIDNKDLVLIVGRVGSGKTSLLMSILGELPIASGRLLVNGHVSYASQQPWIFSGTIRENILFGNTGSATNRSDTITVEDSDSESDHNNQKQLNKMKEKGYPSGPNSPKLDTDSDLDSIDSYSRYREVLRVCSLDRDIELFPDGDQTIVGERGVSLSGGQRARVNLARALYHKADIYLLDDPLSAVDSLVAKHIFEQCMRCFLKDKTVLLATHQLQFLHQATKILVMENSRSTMATYAFGTLEEIMGSGEYSTKLNFGHDSLNQARALRQLSPSSLPIDQAKQEELTSDEIVDKEALKTVRTQISFRPEPALKPLVVLKVNKSKQNIISLKSPPSLPATNVNTNVDLSGQHDTELGTTGSPSSSGKLSKHTVYPSLSDLSIKDITQNTVMVKTLVLEPRTSPDENRELMLSENENINCDTNKQQLTNKGNERLESNQYGVKLPPINCKTYWYYISAAGTVSIVVIFLVANLTTQLLFNTIDYFLSLWADSEERQHRARAMAEQLSLKVIVDQRQLLSKQLANNNVTHKQTISFQNSNGSILDSSNLINSMFRHKFNRDHILEDRKKITLAEPVMASSHHSPLQQAASLLHNSIVHGQLIDQASARSDKSSSTILDDLALRTICIIYLGLVLTLLAASFCRTMIFFNSCKRASRNLHKQLFSSILYAPMSFFDFNPIGVLVNVFSIDMAIVDDLLPQTCMDVIEIATNLIGASILISYISIYNFIPIVTLMSLALVLRWFASRAIIRFKQIEGSIRAPIYSHMATTLNGLCTIRAFKVQKMVKIKFDEAQDQHTRAWFMFLAGRHWLTVAIDWSCVVSFVMVIFIMVNAVLKAEINSSLVGLLISLLILLPGPLQWGVRQLTELQSQMTSVQRIRKFSQLPSEHDQAIQGDIITGDLSERNPKLMEPLLQQPNSSVNCVETATKSPPNIVLFKSLIKPDTGWPNEGRITFENVSLRYFKQEPYVLEDLNFQIGSHEKIGVVGRTGAGKSSIITALFRLTNFIGTITIDDIDIKQLTLVELRKNMSIIPQEPILFNASVRKNLDPFDEYSDDLLWRALEAVKLSDIVAKSPGGLKYKISENGANFSVGQRQLVCLARAIVRRNRILILDEATANVDPETDQFIQKTIRSEFGHCTVLTIAHRLHTIMDSDKVIVMDSGKMKQFDTPYNLLKLNRGIFYEMSINTGQHERFLLLAKENYERKKKITPQTKH